MADNLVNDVRLTNAVPQCEYMHGCVPTAVGMLLAYYDLYGYQDKDFSNLIEGVPELNARGLDGDNTDMDAFDTVLGNFVASEGYVARFRNQSAEDEKDNTWKSLENLEFNTDVWDSLADWLGTGQIWRGNQDYASCQYYASLQKILSLGTKAKITVSEDNVISVPVRYRDWMAGLSLYVESRGYTLDAVQTVFVHTDTCNGTFTFEDYMAEIDAGRPMILSTGTHAMLGYGYNADTREIIFDDCYENERRVTWDGTFLFNNTEMSVIGVSKIVFHTDNHFSGYMYRQSVFSDAFFSGNNIRLTSVSVQGFLCCGSGSPDTAPVGKKKAVVNDVSAERLFLHDNFDHVSQQGTASEITANVTGGSFTKGIIGIGDVKFSTVLANTDITVSETVANVIAGGCYSLEKESGNERNFVNYTGNTALNISDASVSQFIIGGSLIGSNTAENRAGNIQLSVAGTCDCTIVGGTLLQSSADAESTIVGDVTLKLSGATVSRDVYCGSGALKVGATKKTSIVGNTHILIDIGECVSVAGNVIAGGMAKSRVIGTSTVTFTGKNDTPFSCQYISGDSTCATWGHSYVGNGIDANPRSLVFSDFNGTIDAEFVCFDSLEIDEKSVVTIAKTSNFSTLNLISIAMNEPGLTSLSFQNGCSLDFAATELRLTCDLQENDVWTAVQTLSADDFYHFTDAVVYLNGEKLDYDETESFSGYSGENGYVRFDEDTASIQVFSSASLC